MRQQQAVGGPGIVQLLNVVMEEAAAVGGGDGCGGGRQKRVQNTWTIWGAMAEMVARGMVFQIPTCSGTPTNPPAVNCNCYTRMSQLAMLRLHVNLMLVHVLQHPPQVTVPL